MKLEDRAKLYNLLVEFSVEVKEELNQSVFEENVFDKAAVEILLGAKRRGEHFELLDLTKFKEI